MSVELLTIAGQYGLGGALGGSCLWILYRMYSCHLTHVIAEQRKTNKLLRVLIIAMGRGDLLAKEDDT